MMKTLIIDDELFEEIMKAELKDSVDYELNRTDEGGERVYDVRLITSLLDVIEFYSNKIDFEMYLADLYNSIDIDQQFVLKSYFKMKE